MVCGSVEDFSLGWWSVVGCQWVGGGPVGGSMVGGRWVGGKPAGGSVVGCRWSVACRWSVVL